MVDRQARYFSSLLGMHGLYATFWSHLFAPGKVSALGFAYSALGEAFNIDWYSGSNRLRCRSSAGGACHAEPIAQPVAAIWSLLPALAV